MYLASYVVLEIMMQLTRHQLSGAPKAASDTELQTNVEAPVEGEDDDDDDEAPLIKNAKDTTDGTPVIRTGSFDLEAARTSKAKTTIASHHHGSYT